MVAIKGEKMPPHCACCLLARIRSGKSVCDVNGNEIDLKKNGRAWFCPLVEISDEQMA